MVSGLVNRYHFTMPRGVPPGLPADRLFFNPPYHPQALDSSVTFAVAARGAGVEAVVALGQWLASPEHPSLMTRQHWLSDKLFQLLPDTAHVAVGALLDPHRDDGRAYRPTGQSCCPVQTLPTR
jgi:hypothetical protein